MNGDPLLREDICIFFDLSDDEEFLLHSSHTLIRKGVGGGEKTKYWKLSAENDVFSMFHERIRFKVEPGARNDETG